MGVLDDAIRQHLELKRQHGAPEAELQRQEEEALGPARRDVAPVEPPDEASEVELEGAEAADAGEAAEAAEDASAAEADGGAPDTDEHETVLYRPEGDHSEPEDEAEAEPQAHAEAEPAAAEPLAPYDAAADMPSLEQDDEVPAEESLEPTRAEEDKEVEDLFAEDDEPPEGDPEAAHADPEAADADPEAADADSEAADADVLEDTPDFLQETPEHDRLWFEQKPPRDFDFD